MFFFFFFFTDRVNLFWAHHGGGLFWSVMLHLICSDKVTCGSGYCGFTFDFLCSDLSSDIMSGLTICVDDGTWFWLEPPSNKPEDIRHMCTCDPSVQVSDIWIFFLTKE